MRTKTIYALILLVIGAVIYYMTYCTPLYSDDWNYDLVFHLNQKIESLSDVFVSQYYHYLYQNGRTVPHLILQTFDGLLGKGVFNVFNALAFIILLYLISVRFKRVCPQYLVTTSIAFLLLLTLIPSFKESFLWMSGSCNYLWVVDLLLVFDLLIRKENHASRHLPWLFVYGLLCGWTHEGIVIGVSAGYFVYYLLHRSQLTKARMVMLAGLYIGTLLVIVSPGSLQRIHISGHHLDYASSRIEALYFRYDMMAWPVMVILLLLFVLLRKIPFKAFVLRHSMELTTIAVNFLIILYTACTAHRSRFGFEFYALLLVIELLLPLRPVIQRRLALASGILATVLVVMLVPQFHLNQTENENLMSQLETTKTGLIISPWHETPKWADDFILRLRDSNLRNLYIPKHFHLDHVVFVPQRFLDTIDRDSIDYTSFNTAPDLPFYAKVHHGNTPRYAKVRLHATERDAMPLLAKPFGTQIGAYSLTHFSAIADTLSYHGQPYVVVWKQKVKGIPTIHHLDDRITEIQLMD